MAYTKTQWNPGGPPGISAENLNKIEKGIADAHDMIETHINAAAPHIGHETPAGAQEKATAALEAAKQYTDQEVAKVVDDLASHKNENATLNNLGHVYHDIITATLDTEWEGEEAPYTKIIEVEGILGTDVPIIDVVLTDNYETDTAILEAWSCVYRAVTADNSITFYATEKPTIDLPIQIKVVR